MKVQIGSGQCPLHWLWIVGCLLGFSLPALAQSHQPSIQLHVQVPQAEPWAYLQQKNAPIDSPNQKLRGIWIDITQAISQHTQIPFKITLVPSARIVRSIRRGDIDLSFLGQYGEPEPYVKYAGYLFDMGSVIIPHADMELSSYEDLYEFGIGLVRGIPLSPEFDNDQQIFLRRYFRNYETLIGMFYAERLDTIGGDSVSLAYMIRQWHLGSKVGTPLLLHQTNVWVQFSKKSPNLQYASVVEDAVNHLREQGTFDRIVSSYAGTSWKVEQ